MLKENFGFRKQEYQKILFYKKFKILVNLLEKLIRKNYHNLKNPFFFGRLLFFIIAKKPISLSGINKE